MREAPGVATASISERGGGLSSGRPRFAALGGWILQFQGAALRVGFDFLQFFEQQGPLLFVNDESHAPVGAAAAGMLVPGFDVESIVVGEFFASLDVAQGIDPDPPADDVSLTVGGAGVVDVAGGVSPLRSIEVIALIQGKDVNGGAA